MTKPSSLLPESTSQYLAQHTNAFVDPRKTYSLALLIQYLVGTIMHGIWLINGTDVKMQNVSQRGGVISE